MRNSIKKRLTKKRIAVLGPVGIPIPPKKQGGIEWMVHYLTEGLVQRGYPVSLFASPGTKTSAQLVRAFEKPMVLFKPKPEFERARRLRMELSLLAGIVNQLIERKDEIGLVLNHTLHGGLMAHLEKTLDIPMFHILHLPVFKELATVYQQSHARLISLSDAQRKPFPKLNYVATIYNGIDLSKFPFNKKPKDYFLFAGKIIPGKNPLDAILAAKRAKAKLLLAGKVNDQQYFKEKIEPLLDNKIKYLGEVSFNRLLTLYKEAKALLFPIKWQEAFGLVMIESMACGTPVIAYNCASVPEVVKNQKTGLIVRDRIGMVKAIKNIDTIQRDACRKHVEDNFSSERMVDAYENLCKKALHL